LKTGKLSLKDENSFLVLRVFVMMVSWVIESRGLENLLIARFLGLEPYSERIGVRVISMADNIRLLFN